MKWQKKYQIDIKKISELNKQGASLPELSRKYNIPRTTLNRYLRNDGYDVQNNRHNIIISSRKRSLNKTTFSCSESWKKALILNFGYCCAVCGYDKIVEAHHIIPQCNGGKMTIKNGILLCPNHHAEDHAGILDMSNALLKRDELLENPKTDNQQPSLKSKWLNPPRVKKGSTTSFRAKAVKKPRASRSRRKLSNEVLRGMI